MIHAIDCISFMVDLPDASVGVTVTSPPYNIGVPYDVWDDKRKDYIEWSLLWIRQAVRISRSGIVMNIGAKASGRSELYRLLGCIAAEFTIQNEIVWSKSIYVAGKTYGHFKPINSDRYVNNTHELVLHIVAKPTPVDKLAVGVPFEYKQNIERFSGNGGADVRCRGSVWFVPYETRNEKLDHPATYPVELAEMMILYSGATDVFDPFAGSGTTGVACARLGVSFSGTEISSAYAEVANNRIAKLNPFKGILL
jgi:site-specific DNA-methyltransferase (adenine-specific)